MPSAATRLARRTGSRAAVASWLCGALLLRLAGVSRAAWLDEALTLRWVHAAGWHDWVAEVRSDLVPPAYPALLTAWSAISDDLPWLRLFSVACSLGTLAVGMAWTSTTSRRAVLPAALLLSSAPFLLRYAVELRAYALLGLATAWAGCAAWRLASSPGPQGRHATSLLLALLLACLTHFTGVLLVPAAVVLVLVGTQDRPRTRVPWLGLFGVCLVWAVVVAGSRAPGAVGAGWWMPSLTPRLAWLTLGEVLGASSPAGGMPPVMQGSWVALLVALGAVVTLAEPSREWTAPLGAALAYWLCLAGASLLWEPVWWPRTLLPGFVLLLVSVAVASQWLRTARLRVAAVSLILLLSVMGATRWVAGEGQTSIEPWTRAVAALPGAGARAPLFVVPDYAAAPLIEAVPGRRDAVVALRLDGRGNREALASALATAGTGSGFSLVVRVDLTTERADDRLTSVLTQIATVRGAAPARVLLVTSPDASLVPGLRRSRARIEAVVTRLFGPPARRVEDPALTSLDFPPPR